jgi:glutamyl-tRNA synthetase
MMSVRVRFAPSPTGLLHVGALRDALFKSLFARRHGGVNILRIEDTDRTRYNPDSEQEFIDTLRWVGIEFDEGPHIGGPNAPYRQSERKEAGIYAEQIAVLLEKGQAYKAFETPEELEQMREYQKINKLPTGYFGGDWRDASPEKVAEAEASGKPYVIRQRIPRGQTIVFEDVIRGRIEWESDLLDDPVLIKADGMPTYHFAAMVDDHLMGITHIIRGEEWISSAPKHVALFDQFGWERPIFVHCPVIVGTDGKKLSKRHGATRVLDYAAEGYLPEGLKNFIALIGWSPGDEREVMTEDELVQAFALEGLQPSPGRFDIEKLAWLNGAHIRALEPEALMDALLAYIREPFTRQYWTEFVEENPMPNKPPKDGKALLARLDRITEWGERDRAYLLEAVKLEQERVQTLADFGEALEFFLMEEPPMDEKAVAKWFKHSHVKQMLSDFADRTGQVPEEYEAAVAFWDAELRSYQEKLGIDKLGPVVHPTRVALTGKTYGPGLFELMALLGPARVKARLLRSAEIAAH